MKDQFSIAFISEGRSYTAKVYPDLDEEGKCFYQVNIQSFTMPLFVHMSEDRSVNLWQIKDDVEDQLDVTEDFIYQIGNAIEAESD